MRRFPFGLLSLWLLMALPASALEKPAGDSRGAVAAAAAAEAAEVDEVVRAYVNDIHELDFRTQSYAVDLVNLYVWFRWRNKEIDPSKSLEFMNRFAPDDHVRDQIYDQQKLLPDGSFY